MVTEFIEIACVGLGAFFMFVASLGMLRLADFYARIHAPTKAATLGLAFLLVALAIHLHDLVTITKALLAMLFIGMTAPAGAHILARAAYRNSVRPIAKIDQYAAYARQREGGENSLKDAHDERR
jgi:multicomponent Na+:H+ antiporter subunit G